MRKRDFLRRRKRGCALLAVFGIRRILGVAFRAFYFHHVFLLRGKRIAIREERVKFSQVFRQKMSFFLSQKN